MYHAYTQYCNQQERLGRYRMMPSLAPENRLLIDFSSNDYLNFAQDPELQQAAFEACRTWGLGATGSRLLSGNVPVFNALEQQIALDKNTEQALIFNTGFQANATVLASLLNEKVLGQKAIVFFDKLNHASLYQAIFSSGATLVRYHHADPLHLEKCLQKHAEHNRPKFIVTETVFGMDGDTAPLEKIIALTQQHQAFLYLDEAHATGILGPHGYGLSTQFDLSAIAHCVMGTFSKALGIFGAYLACNTTLKHYLINHCPGLIYTTALPPMVLGAALCAWNRVRTLTPQRHHLLQQAHMLRQQLQQQGWETGSSCTHIIPLFKPHQDDVLSLQQKLKQQGILVSAIRPPTVPPGTERLRLALTLKHSKDDLTALLRALS